MGTFYIENPEIAYVHIPRTGMAMKKIISDWLKTYFHVIDNEDWQIDHPHIGTVKTHYPTAFTFSVVRNPWARVFSLYKKIKTEGYWLDWNNLRRIDLKPVNDWILDYVNPDVPFDFPRWFTRFTNQVDFIQSQGSTIDFICKAECLEKDFTYIKEYLKCYKPLPDISNYDNYEYKKYLNQKSINAITKMYEKDVDYFKYKSFLS